MSRRSALAAVAAAIALGGAGCGSSASSPSSASTPSAPASEADPNAPEVNPAGDIPDNQAFVAYTPARRRLLGQGARGLVAQRRRAAR